ASPTRSHARSDAPARSRATHPGQL
ncbi:MAG: hypothetical protein, partial [Olavius algarvensis Gamma 3 endosymbiont]